MTIDWSKMTPGEAFEALRAAPKVAGPWQPGFPWDAVRCTPDGRRVARSTVDGVFVSRGADGTDEASYDSREEADEALRWAGWMLVDEEDS